jgi:hypothetical protein
MKINKSSDEPKPDWKCPHCGKWNSHFISGNWGKKRCPECRDPVDGMEVDTQIVRDDAGYRLYPGEDGYEEYAENLAGPEDIE